MPNTPTKQSDRSRPHFLKVSPMWLPPLKHCPIMPAATKHLTNSDHSLKTFDRPCVHLQKISPILKCKTWFPTVYISYICIFPITSFRGFLHFDLFKGLSQKSLGVDGPVCMPPFQNITFQYVFTWFQVSFGQRWPTWTEKPEKCTPSSSKPKIWPDQWGGFQGPPPSTSHSPTSTTIHPGFLKVCNTSLVFKPICAGHLQASAWCSSLVQISIQTKYKVLF